MLATKYRPSQFSDVVGQDVCIKILEKQVAENSYSHAILFAGKIIIREAFNQRFLQSKLMVRFLKLTVHLIMV